ncbi:hypothetical protein ACQH8B_28575, partial [Klebsiella pneumoniae]
MPNAWDNMQSIDKFVNSSDETITTRTGKQLDTLHGVNVKADNQLTQQQADFETSQEERDAVVEETRQNLIPLSRQYMTLADAQADIANIPDGSTTYYRSPDDSALAIEVMNVGGTLTATGREMPSQQAVINVNTALRELIDELPNDVLFLFSDSDGFRIADIALDQTGKPVLSLGRLSLSRNSGSALEVTDADGFTISV